MSKDGRYRRKLREKAYALFGNKCAFCEASTVLEFAHIKPTTTIGWGRGMDRRFRDILKNVLAYCLLCPDHHEELDGEAYRNKHYREEKDLTARFLFLLGIYTNSDSYEPHAKNNARTTS